MLRARWWRRASALQSSAGCHRESIYGFAGTHANSITARSDSPCCVPRRSQAHTDIDVDLASTGTAQIMAQGSVAELSSCWSADVRMAPGGMHGMTTEVHGGRILDTAKGILIGLRRCTSEAGFPRTDRRGTTTPDAGVRDGMGVGASGRWRRTHSRTHPPTPTRRLGTSGASCSPARRWQSNNAPRQTDTRFRGMSRNQPGGVQAIGNVLMP